MAQIIKIKLFRARRNRFEIDDWPEELENCVNEFLATIKPQDIVNISLAESKLNRRRNTVMVVYRTMSDEPKEEQEALTPATFGEIDE